MKSCESIEIQENNNIEVKFRNYKYKSELMNKSIVFLYALFDLAYYLIIAMGILFAFDLVSFVTDLRHNLEVSDHIFLVCDFLIVFAQHRTYEDVASFKTPRHWKYQGLVPVLVHTLPLWLAIVLTFYGGYRMLGQAAYILSYLAAFPLARKVGGNRAFVSAGYMTIASLVIGCSVMNFDLIHMFRLTQSHILTRSSIRFYRAVFKRLGQSETDAYSLGQVTGGLFGCWYAYDDWMHPLLWYIMAFIVARMLPREWLASSKVYPYRDPSSDK